MTPANTTFVPPFPVGNSNLYRPRNVTCIPLPAGRGSSRIKLAMLDRSTHAAGATAVLVALFCAFFFLGFYTGKHSKPEQVIYRVPASPAGERVEWRAAVHQQPK